MCWQYIEGILAVVKSILRVIRKCIRDKLGIYLGYSQSVLRVF